MASINYYKYKIKQLTYTQWLIGMNIFMFIITKALDLFNVNAYLVLGAKVNTLIAFGEYWRLITSMFLHADFMHIIFNMLALYILGRDIERFYGKRKFLFIYFFSGIFGAITSYVFIPNMSVGASGAIFGLMGANLYLYKINPTVYKRIYGSDFLVLIGINLVLGFVYPNIDIAGHLGGLVAGFFASWSVGLSFEKAFATKRLLMQATLIIVTCAYLAIGTYLNTNTPGPYLSAADYYANKDNYSKAIKIIQRGAEKFPDIIRLNP